MSKMKQYIDQMTPLEAYQKGYEALEELGYEEYRRGIKEVVDIVDPIIECLDASVQRKWQAWKKKWGINSD